MTCFAASGAEAAPAPAVFRLTITATSVADFDHTTASVAHLDCQASSRAEGFRITTFRSSRPTLTRFVGGRLQPVVVGGLHGTVKLSGTNTSNLVCDVHETHAPDYCAKTTRAFENARVTLSSAADGAIGIRSPRVALHRIHCPDEPDEVVALPLGIVPGPLRVSPRTLTNSRTTRIVLTASARGTRTYASPEAGFVQQRAAWRLTFVRTGR